MFHTVTHIQSNTRQQNKIIFKKKVKEIYFIIKNISTRYTSSHEVEVGVAEGITKLPFLFLLTKRCQNQVKQECRKVDFNRHR